MGSHAGFTRDKCQDLMYTSEGSLASSRLRIDYKSGGTRARPVQRLLPIEMMVDQAGGDIVKWSYCG